MDENLAAVLYGAQDLRIEPIATPKPADNELLIKVHTVGVCGSDVHYWAHGSIGNFIVKDAMVVGHETSGVVIKVGKDVGNFQVGDRVALEPGLPCSSCDYCQGSRYNLCPYMRFFATPPIHGTLARYVCHDAKFCFKLPDNISFEDGALLEPLSVAVHCANRANFQKGQRVLILGSGTIGILNLLTFKALGAEKVVVTDIEDKRLALAKDQGADFTINVRGLSPQECRDKIKQFFNGEDPHVTLECTGAQSCIETAMITTRSGGNIILVGLGASRVEIPIIEASVREVDIKGIFRYVNCYPTALDLLTSGKINLSGLSRAHYKLEDTEEALKRTQKADVLKVFIKC